MAYLAKCGPYFVKSVEGMPCFRSTGNRDEAARFPTEAAAREWAPQVFSGELLSRLVVEFESSEGSPRHGDGERKMWVRAEGRPGSRGGRRHDEEEYDIHGAN